LNLPNKLTLLRVAMIPVFMLVLYLRFPGSNYVALGIFVAASFTDYIDGKIARERNLVTDFGKFMDPLADKILVCAALIWFTAIGLVPAWAVLIVITREFAVTALRLIAVQNGVVIAAGLSGKIKTASTMLCIIILFFPVPKSVVWICVIAITATTLYSGVEYFIQNKSVLSVKK
jgi:CDP-diacylglycerol--glycerol-3-phosphate 3-phosphatidyltransferase